MKDCTIELFSCIPTLHDSRLLLVRSADGFPRTALQVDFLKLLYDKMLELHTRLARLDTQPGADHPPTEGDQR